MVGTSNHRVDVRCLCVMIFFLFLAHLFSGRLEPSSTRANILPQPGRTVAVVSLSSCQEATSVFTADAPAGSELTPEAVQQRRSQFVGLVRMGLFERFDDARQEVIFKRNDPTHSVHEPGPLEDEAIASAARESLATLYARLKLKPRLSCTSGKLAIGNLPDDPIMAATVIDTVLALDGVQTVSATLPPSLRTP